MSNNQEIEEVGCDDVISEKKKSLSMMNFSVKEVAFAINSLGEDASVSNLVDFIISAQTAGSSREKESTNKTLVGTMDKRLYLLEMGFSENEISEAIDNFGSEVPLLELADSIFAKQIANSPVQLNKTLEDAAVELKMKMLQSASVIALL